MINVDTFQKKAIIGTYCIQLKYLSVTVAVYTPI